MSEKLMFTAIDLTVRRLNVILPNKFPFANIRYVHTNLK